MKVGIVTDNFKRLKCSASKRETAKGQHVMKKNNATKRKRNLDKEYDDAQTKKIMKRVSNSNEAAVNTGDAVKSNQKILNFKGTCKVCLFVQFVEVRRPCSVRFPYGTMALIMKIRYIREQWL